MRKWLVYPEEYTPPSDGLKQNVETPNFKPHEFLPGNIVSIYTHTTVTSRTTLSQK